MSRVRSVLVALAVGVSAGVPARAAETLSTGWTGTLAAEEAYNDNVEQKEGAEREGDFITTLTGRAEWQNSKPRWFPSEIKLIALGRIYNQLSQFNYPEVEAEIDYALWWRADGVLAYSYSGPRLLFEEATSGDDILYTEHAMVAGLRRKFGEQKQIRARLLFTGAWQNFDPQDSARDSFAPGLEGEVRYRLPSLFQDRVTVTPRIGVEYAHRRAVGENYDRDTVVVAPGFDLQLPWDARLRVRYERSWRDYPVGSAKDGQGNSNNNFGREDAIDQYQTWLTIPLGGVQGLSLGARYRYRQGVFNEPNRKGSSGVRGIREEFAVNEFGVEVSYLR